MTSLHPGLIVAIVAWFFAVLLLGLGNTVGYHRLLTHRAFVAKPGLRGVLTILGAMHGGAPMMWVGLHRLHHAKSDTEEDPHTPTKGFWHGHSGWLINTTNPVLSMMFALSGFGQQLVILKHDVLRVAGRNPPVWRQLCPDLQKEPLMRFLGRPFVTPALFWVQLALVWFLAGGWGLVWLWSVHLFLTNASWAVNSVCHWPRFGHRSFDTGEDSRNVPLMTWVTNGESWHNNHHRYPRSAWHALGEGPDLSWQIIRGLVAVGLAEAPWLPRSHREAA